MLVQNENVEKLSHCSQQLISLGLEPFQWDMPEQKQLRSLETDMMQQLLQAYE